MKKSICFLIAISSLFTSSMAYSAVYVCQSGGCTTTINDGDGYSGFTWEINCTDGTYGYGEVPGAAYGGNCPMVSE